jgi:hypothetical protein
MDDNDRYWDKYFKSVRESLHETCEDILYGQKKLRRLFRAYDPNSKVYQSLNILGTKLSSNDVRTFFDAYRKLSVKYTKITDEIQLSLFEECSNVVGLLDVKASTDASNYTEEIGFQDGLENNLTTSSGETTSLLNPSILKH